MAKAAAKKKKKKQPGGPSFASRLRDGTVWFSQPRRLANATLAIVWVALGLTAAVGAGPLKERVTALRDAPVTPRIEWPALPGDPSSTWLPASEQRRLDHLVVQTVTTDAFDRDSLEALRATLDASGWFARVDEVRRLPENTIRVRGQWRAPAAAVRVSDRDHLVTAAGELLPLAYAHDAAGPGIPVILNAQFGPPENDARGFAYGRRWRGGDVPASLTLLTELRRAFGATPHIMRQVAGVDASEYRQRGRLLIVTDTGSRIVWGSAPGDEKPGEVRAAEKISRLVQLAGSGQGRIDNGAMRIEVFGPHVYIDQTQPR